MATFYKSFDTVLEELIRDYENMDESPDVTEGSIAWIKAACLASMGWGIYKYQDWLSKQIFIDTCDGDNLDKWGTEYGIVRLSGELDGDYAKRIIASIQKPVQPGTVLDYQEWALSQSSLANVREDFSSSAVNVAGSQITVTQSWMQDMQVGYESAPIPSSVHLSTTGTLPSPLNDSSAYYMLPLNDSTVQLSATRSPWVVITLGSAGTGTHTFIPDQTTEYYAQSVVVNTPESSPPTSLGTLLITYVPNDLNIINTPAVTTLTDTIADYIETLRPVTNKVFVKAVGSIYDMTVDITITPLTLSTSALAQMRADIAEIFANLDIGQPLYRSQLTAACVNNGAITVTINQPASDYYPLYYELIQISGDPIINGV